MSNEVLAYDLGYRAFESNVYNNGVLVKSANRGNRLVFNFYRKNLVDTVVPITRLIAYQNNKIFRNVLFKDGNPYNLKMSNLIFGYDYERLSLYPEFMSKELMSLVLGYSVSSTGSLLFYGNTVNRISYSSEGYQYFKIRNAQKKTKNVFVHRLQAYQKYFNKIYLKDTVVRHLDGLCTNNSVQNISIGSYQDNRNDISASVMMQTSEKISQTLSNYNSKKRVEVRELFDAGWTYKRLMKKFGYSKSTIYRINVLER